LKGITATFYSEDTNPREIYIYKISKGLLNEVF